MRYVWFIWGLLVQLWLLAAVVLLALFVLANPETAPLSLPFNLWHGQLPVWAIAFAGFCLGVLLTFFCTRFGHVWLKLSLKHTRRKLAAQRAEPAQATTVEPISELI